MNDEQKEKMLEDLDKRFGIVGVVDDNDGSSAQLEDFWFAINRKAGHVCILRMPESEQNWVVFSTKPLSAADLAEYKAAVELEEDE